MLSVSYSKASISAWDRARARLERLTLHGIVILSAISQIVSDRHQFCNYSTGCRTLLLLHSLTELGDLKVLAAPHVERRYPRMNI